MYEIYVKKYIFGRFEGVPSPPSWIQAYMTSTLKKLIINKHNLHEIDIYYKNL
jgi:hypothetical protein